MSLFFLAAAVAGGVSLTLLEDDGATPWVRLARGAVVGIALWAILGYVLASFLGMSAASVGLASALVLGPAAVVPRDRWRLLAPAWPGATAVVYALAMGVLLVLLFERAFFVRDDAPAQEGRILVQDGGIFTGIEHNLGDLPFHLSIVMGFVRGDNFPPEHPELSGTRLTYPFLADFGVAQLVCAGLALRPAMLVQNAVLALALFALLHHLTRELTGDAWAARIAPLLVFLSGGLGFVQLFAEASGSGGQSFVALLRKLPHDYTITADGRFRFGNTMTCLLATQRSLLLGSPLFLIALERLWRATDASLDSRRRRSLLAGAGMLAALMPLAHAHALASLLAIAFALALLFPPRRAWLVFFGIALVVAVPQALWLAQGSAMKARGFLAWQPGWDSGGRNPFSFWLWNAGLFLPLLLLAERRLPARLLRFHLPFWGLFIAPNLLKLSPWVWDNIKFLFFFLLGSAPLVALLVARLLRRPALERALGACLLVLLTLSGALDVWRVVSRQIALRIFDPAGIALAAEIARVTPPRALVLHAPTYDSPAQLSGRRAVLGYPGHTWSQGFDPGAREAEIGRIYAGSWEAEAALERHGVDFILVGPQERSLYRVDEGFLSRFPVVLRFGPYELRTVR